LRRIALVILTLALLGLPARSDSPAEPASIAELASEDERLGYTIGYQVGGDFRRMQTALDPDLVVEGLRHALERTPPRLTAAEMREALSEVRAAESSEQ